MTKTDLHTNLSRYQELLLKHQELQRRYEERTEALQEKLQAQATETNKYRRLYLDEMNDSAGKSRELLRLKELLRSRRICGAILTPIFLALGLTTSLFETLPAWLTPVTALAATLAIAFGTGWCE